MPIKNAYQTTTMLGTFGIQSQGLVQGIAQDDPAVRFALTGGKLDYNETQPMFGGVALKETIVNAGNGNLGNSISRAASVADIAGFSVMNQAHHMLIDGEDDVPQIAGGGSVHYFRVGSRARIAVACTEELLALTGNNTAGPQVTWDFNANALVPYYPATDEIATTAIDISSEASTATGMYTVTVTAAAHNRVTGDTVTLSGITPAAYNGTYDVTVVDANTFTYQLPTNPGAVTAQGTVAAGGGAFLSSVRILRVAIGNSKTVQIDPLTGVLTWNNSGTAALIEI